jgi:pyruvate dehydrogenase phosphatase
LCAGNQGHLGDTTVEHAAHHLPVIVNELLHKLIPTPDAPLPTPDTIRHMLSSQITEFDNAIAGDVLELFPGGIESLPDLTDEEIQAVVNDFSVPGGVGSNGAGAGTGANYKKARLCLYGTTALVALVDPSHENLWVANLGDCEAGTCLARKQKNHNKSRFTKTILFCFFSHQCW